VLRVLLALSLCASAAHAGDYRLPGRTPRVPATAPRPQITICIDKDFIRRVVRRHQAAFAGCYERELRRAPRLAGTVTATFVILSDGRVASAEASGMTPGLDACVARAVAAIRFPRIVGGGSVRVNYPFAFSQRGP
jgi:outer membrane biosynthesis protein TonB